MSAGVALRRASPADAQTLVALLAEGFERYHPFAPEGWEPPRPEPERQREALGDDAVWCLVAEAGPAVVGHVSLMPAARARQPVPDAALAYLWQLFVRPAEQGTGLAARLLAAAQAEAAARGYAAMRLVTPAAHGRARRFYEREGGTLRGEPFHDPEFGMAIVELRRALS